MEQIKERYKIARGSISSLNYHLVWCPKRRKSVLVGLIEQRLKEILELKAKSINIEIKEINIMPDHVHLFVSCGPEYAPHQIVKQLKGISSNILRKEFPQLLRLPALWSGSYYIGSVGFVSEDVIKEYIKNQKGK